MVGLPDIGCRAGAAALVDHVPSAPFALPALRRHAQFKLDFIKAHASTGVAGNVAVRDAAADADNHGGHNHEQKISGQDLRMALNGAGYKTRKKQKTQHEEIINANLSH